VADKSGGEELSGSSREVDLNVSSIGSQLSTPAEPTPAHQVSAEQRTLIHAVKAVNAAELYGHDNQLTYVVDRQTKRTVVRIVNRETGELVDQIPEEYVLRLAEELKGR
jgi:flagellar protein FlaG